MNVNPNSDTAGLRVREHELDVASTPRCGRRMARAATWLALGCSSAFMLACADGTSFMGSPLASPVSAFGSAGAGSALPGAGGRVAVSTAGGAQVSAAPGGANAGAGAATSPTGAAGMQLPPAASDNGGAGGPAGDGVVASGGPDALLEGECPANYEPKAGFNRDFPSGGLMRAFYVIPPPDVSKGMAVWVPLTGTEESTDQNLQVQRSGNNQAVAQAGYMVLGPVRICANQDPKITNQNCSGPGPDPYMYIPWRDGAASGKPTSHAVYKEEGPDSVFLEQMVRCVAKKYPILKNKLYLGGISAGGSMTHRALTFNSDFWAGGVPVSGEWRTSAKDGKVLNGDQSEAQMSGDPKGVYPGRTAPFPLPKLDAMVVVTIRGGPTDTWPGTSYKPDAQAASNFYASQEKVVSVVCMGNWGHQWPKDMNDANWTNLFNKWVVDLMASHPKGTPPSQFKLTTPPKGAGFSCKLGRFDQLYGS